MILTYVGLCVSAFFAGILNAVAGGGTLLTFPALFAALPADPISATIANATSTTALLPGSFAGAWGYRTELRDSRALLVRLIWPSLIGGGIGTLLVTELDPSIFQAMVPWLILMAAVLFALQKPISNWIKKGRTDHAPTGGTLMGVLAFQFVVAVYGGYFGAGIGILMLTALSFMDLRDIHQMNGVKTVLASTINLVSVVIFAISGQIRWDLAGIMAGSAIAGGYLGARVARRLPAVWVRSMVIVIAFSLAIFYFIRQWLNS